MMADPNYTTSARLLLQQALAIVRHQSPWQPRMRITARPHAAAVSGGQTKACFEPTGRSIQARGHWTEVGR